MYMPILMLVTWLAVQFSMNYLGNAAASAVARESARRAGQRRPRRRRLAGHQYAANVVNGSVGRRRQGRADRGDRIRAVDTGRAQESRPGSCPA